MTRAHRSTVACDTANRLTRPLRQFIQRQIQAANHRIHISVEFWDEINRLSVRQMVQLSQPDRPLVLWGDIDAEAAAGLCFHRPRTSIVSAATEPEAVAAIAATAAFGYRLDYARAPGSGNAEPVSTVDLSVDEIQWLNALADGDTIEELADRHAYSPRHMARKLRIVYSALGTSNKTQALIQARTIGII